MLWASFTTLMVCLLSFPSALAAPVPSSDAVIARGDLTDSLVAVGEALINELIPSISTLTEAVERLEGSGLAQVGDDLIRGLWSAAVAGSPDAVHALSKAVDAWEEGGANLSELGPWAKRLVELKAQGLIDFALDTVIGEVKAGIADVLTLSARSLEELD